MKWFMYSIKRYCKGMKMIIVFMMMILLLNVFCNFCRPFYDSNINIKFRLINFWNVCCCGVLYIL